MIENFGFYRLYTHTKQILVTMLEEFFSLQDPKLNITAPTIKFFEYNKDFSYSKLSIHRDWYQRIRKLPFLVISLRNLREKLLSLDHPQLLSEYVETISDNESSYIDFGHAIEMDSIITIAAEDADARGNLIDLLFFFFTLYSKRVRYFGDDTDRNRFVFSIPKKEISIGGENEVSVGQKNLQYIYTAEINVPVFIEAHYSMQIRDIAKFLQIQGNIK